MNMHRKNRGVTLIELMVTIAVMAILAALSVPSLTELIKSNQISSQSNELIAMIHLARNEAIRRNPTGGETVSLEISATGSGWEGSVRPPGDTDTAVGCPQGAIRCGSFESSTITPEPLTLQFDSRGYSVGATGDLLPQNISVVHKDCSRSNQAIDISITGTGQVSTQDGTCQSG